MATWMSFNHTTKPDVGMPQYETLQADLQRVMGLVAKERGSETASVEELVAAAMSRLGESDAGLQA